MQNQQLNTELVSEQFYRVHQTLNLFLFNRPLITMNKFTYEQLAIGIIAFSISVAQNYFSDVRDDNKIAHYTSDNLPANCRALIKVTNDNVYNLRSFKTKEFDNESFAELQDYINDANETIELAKASLVTIDRNCGDNGNLWSTAIQK